MSDLKLAIKLTTEGGKIVVKDMQQIDAATEKVNQSLGATGKSGVVAQQGLQKASGGADALTGSLKSTIAQAVGIVGLGIAVNSLVRSIIDVGNITQGWDASMQAITGSQKLANQELEHSRDLAKRLGLDIKSTTDSYVQFTAATSGTALEGFKTTKVFDAVSEAMRVLNRSSDDTAGALKALEQMVSKGNVQAEELRGQLGERLPGAFNLAARAMGKTTQELNKMLDNGEVLAADLLPKLADVLTQKYGSGLAIALNSPAQSFRNLKTETFEFNEALSQVFFDDFASGAQTLADGLEAVSGHLPEILSLAELLVVIVGGHLAKAFIASGNGLIANTIASNAKLQSNIKLQASELVLAKSAQHKAIQEQLAAKRSLSMAKNTYLRSAAINNLAAANTKAIVSERALTVATNAHNTAMKKANITSRLLSGSMALVGGPVGVAMLAGYALYEMSTAMGETRTAAQQLEEDLGKTTKAIELMTRAELLSTQAMYNKVITEKKTAIEELKNLAKEQAEQANNTNGKNSSTAYGVQSWGTSEEAKTAAKELEVLKNALSDVEGALFDAGMEGIQWNERIVNGAELTTETVVGLSKDTQSLIDKLDPLMSLSRQYGEDMKGLHQAYSTGVITLSEYQKYIALLNVEYKKSTASKNTDLTANQKYITALSEQIHMLSATAKEKLLHANLSQLSEERTLAEIKAVQDLTDAQYEQLQVNAKKQDDSEYYQSVIDGASDISESWNTAGNVIVNTFGTIGEQLEKLAQQQESYASKQKKLAADKLKYADDPKQLGEIAKAENALAKQKDANAMSEISSYRAITDSAASMFSENSKGRKAMQAASDVFTAIELANSALRIGSYAIEAVAAAFAAPWPIGFASGAAMIAIMAGLGVAVSGSAGSAPTSAADRQESQGTGTVLGSDDKSASILNSYERIEELELDQYAELREMNTSLSDLNNNITYLATSFVSNFGKFDAESYSGELGKTSKYNSNGHFEKMGSEVLSVVDPLLSSTGFGDPLGGLVDSLIGSFNTTKTSLIDSGISIVSQTLGEIIDSGLVDAQQYFDIKTKKKSWWGLSSSTSYDTEYQDVDQQLQHEMALIFGDIGNSINAAINVLGFDVTKSLDDFVIDLPNISFKDLSGEEIQAQLEGIISSESDKMATYQVPALQKYQQVGEGLYETLIRLAQEQAVFNSVLEITGNTLSSIDASQTVEATQAIIGFAGGIENLQSAASDFFNGFYSEAEQFEFMQKQLNAQFAALGQELPTTADGFKNLISALDPLNEADQQLYAQLLLLSGQSAEYYDALQSTIEAEQELADARKSFNDDLTEQIAQMDFSPLEQSLYNLNSQYVEDLANAIELGADVQLLEVFYGKQRTAIIEEQLLSAQTTFDTAITAIGADLEKLIDSISNSRDGIAASIRDIKKQMGSFDEVAFINSNINGLYDGIGSGDISSQIDAVESLNDLIMQRYDLELEQQTQAQDVRTSLYEEELAQYDSLKSALESISSYSKGLSLSSYSPLSSSQRLSVASSGFSSDVSAAQNFDLTALENLGTSADAYLEEARQMFGSSSQFTAIFNSVQSSLNQIANLDANAPVQLSVDELYQKEALQLQTGAITELQSLGLLLDDLEAQANNQAAAETVVVTEQFNAQVALIETTNEISKAQLEKQTQQIVLAEKNIEVATAQLESQKQTTQQLTETVANQAKIIDVLNKQLDAQKSGNSNLDLTVAGLVSQQRQA